MVCRSSGLLCLMDQKDISFTDRQVVLKWHQIGQCAASRRKEERNESIEQQDGDIHGIRHPKNDKNIKSIRGGKSVTGVSGF